MTEIRLRYIGEEEIRQGRGECVVSGTRLSIVAVVGLTVLVAGYFVWPALIVLGFPIGFLAGLWMLLPNLDSRPTSVGRRGNGSGTETIKERE